MPWLQQILNLPRTTKLASALISLLSLNGCAEKPPEWIFVPGSGYQCVLKIELPARIRVGEQVVLQAERTNGPWKRVRPHEVIPGITPWTQEPPTHESGFDVTGNIRWEVAPAGSAKFSGEARRTRIIQFTAPGHYTVRAFTAFPTTATSNEVELVVG